MRAKQRVTFDDLYHLAGKVTHNYNDCLSDTVIAEYKRRMAEICNALIVFYGRTSPKSSTFLNDEILGLYLDLQSWLIEQAPAGSLQRQEFKNPRN